jgi:hypothetical protein
MRQGCSMLFTQNRGLSTIVVFSQARTIASNPFNRRTKLAGSSASSSGSDPYYSPLLFALVA